MALKDDLVSYWNGSFSGDDALDVHGSNDGTAINSRVFDATGKIDKGFDFTQGNDYINTNLKPVFDDYSISFWIKDYIIPTAYGRRYFGSMSGSGQSERFAGEMRSTDEFLWDDRRGGNSVTATTTGGYFDSDVWTHVVVTAQRDGDLKIYVNGVERASESGIHDSEMNVDANIFIGNVNGGFQTQPRSMFDEVAIWSRAISSSEVTDIYNNGNGLAYSSWDVAAGWTGKINGVTNPAKINGIAVANISKVNGQ